MGYEHSDRKHEILQHLLKSPWSDMAVLNVCQWLSNRGYWWQLRGTRKVAPNAKVADQYSDKGDFWYSRDGVNWVRGEVKHFSYYFTNRYNFGNENEMPFKELVICPKPYFDNCEERPKAVYIMSIHYKGLIVVDVERTFDHWVVKQRQVPHYEEEHLQTQYWVAADLVQFHRVEPECQIKPYPEDVKEWEEEGIEKNINLGYAAKMREANYVKM